MHHRQRRPAPETILLARTASQDTGRVSRPRPCEPSVALLIDGENCSPEVAAAVLAKAGEFGRVQVRRVYANWALASNRAWMEPVARYDIRPIHHEPTATGKNATDILLAVDAVELLYTSGITCFCLVASDSDYTPLVARLRAAERTVVVIGRAKTLPSLVQASSVFVSLEDLAGPAPLHPSSSETPPPAREASRAPVALVPAPTLKAEMAPASARVPIPASGLTPASTPTTLPAVASKGEPAMDTEVSPARSPKSAPAPTVTPGPRAAASLPTRPLSAPVPRASSGPAPAPGIAALIQGSSAGSGGVAPAKALLPAQPPDPGPLLMAVWEQVRKEHGAVFVSTFIAEFERLHPNFQPQIYGCGWVAQLLKKHDDLFTLRRDAINLEQILVLRARDVPAPAQEQEPTSVKQIDVRFLQILEAAWREAPRQDGWLFLGAFGHQLKQIAPDFKPSDYGYKNLGSLIRALPEFFELRQRGENVQDVRFIGGRSRPGKGSMR